MIRGKTLAYGLVLVLAVAGSIALLHSRFNDTFAKSPMMSCSKTDTADGAYRADLRFLAGLDSTGRGLVQLTDGGESASDVLKNLKMYRALLVVTAGRSTLTRRSGDQPFIAIAREELNYLQQRRQKEQEEEQQQQEQQQQEQEEQQQDEEQQQGRRQRALTDPKDAEEEEDDNIEDANTERQPAPENDDSGLAALAGAAGLMNSAAAGLERVLGRRLFPITISLFDRTAGGTIASGPYAVFDASAGQLLLDRQFVSYTWGADKPQVSYIAGQLASRVFTQMADMLHSAASTTGGSSAAAATADEDEAAGGGGAPRVLHTKSLSESGGGGAAAAAQIAAAALAVALPAAFAAAPPLWFCVLCPSVLGLLAPLMINLTLNQLAGLLCSQLHLTDDACFDVLLGALGAGFVLSLASAVPIFFVCQLPQCAGHNVTAALRQLTGAAAAAAALLRHGGGAAGGGLWR